MPTRVRGAGDAAGGRLAAWRLRIAAQVGQCGGNRQVRWTGCWWRMQACFAAAHRGLSLEFTENTVAAFQAAREAGFRACELDVRLTRDGEVIVLHDPALERTTIDGHGRIAEMRYDEVRASVTPHGPVPRLDDLFAAMKGWDAVWNLEVKAVQATEGTLALVQHHGMASRVLVSSFQPDVLAIARDAAPDVARALIVSGPVEAEELRMARDLGCRWLNVSHDDLDAATVQAIRDAGMRCGAWTVNDPATALALAQRGVSCVMTDGRPVLAALGDVPSFV